MIKAHNVERKERLRVNINFKFPSPHLHKSYEDKRRHYSMKIDKEDLVIINEESVLSENLRLRALVVIKKMFGTKIDSSLAYRVGENFGLLRIGDNNLRVSFSFNEDNTLNVLDNSSHILQSKILEISKTNQDV